MRCPLQKKYAWILSKICAIETNTNASLDVLLVAERLSLAQNPSNVIGLVSQFDCEGPIIVSFVNAHAINLCFIDARFRESILQSQLLLRDGVGMEVFLKMIGRSAGGNNNGTDLIPKLIAALPGRRAVVLGTAEPWLSIACAEAEKHGIRVVARSDGFQTTDYYIKIIEASSPDIILLGMGMPKQEFVASKLSCIIKHRCIIINGGAILDFMAQRFPRAPKYIRVVRLEWAFRLLTEPKRLWRRYLLGGLSFIMIVVRVVLLKWFCKPITNVIKGNKTADFDDLRQ